MTTATREDRLENLREDLAPSFARSRAYFESARSVIPGGAARARFAFPFPIVIERGEGARLWDIDGNEYVDGLGAFGPMVLGHRHPEVTAAISAQLEHGLMFGSASTDEAAVAERVVANVPGAEKVVMLTSGTEATMAALRLARAATGRDKIAKFVGGWHGSHDAVLQGVWSVSGEPDSLVGRAEGPGIPKYASDLTVILPWNDRRAFDRIRREANDLACVILELIQGGAGALEAERSFVEELRAVCDATGVLLVVDEVLTGFRCGLSGASGLYGVTGDLVSLGKIVAGGLPGSAVAGRAELIAQTSDPADALRDQTILMAGTNAGHPLSMAAGRATLDVLIRDKDTIYPRLFALGERVREGLREATAEAGFGKITGNGPLWGFHATDDGDGAGAGALTSDAKTALSGLLLREGVFVSSPAHLGFLSAAHTAEDADRIVAAHRAALDELRQRGFC